MTDGGRMKDKHKMMLIMLIESKMAKIGNAVFKNCSITLYIYPFTLIKRIYIVTYFFKE